MVSVAEVPEGGLGEEQKHVVVLRPEEEGGEPKVHRVVLRLVLLRHLPVLLVLHLHEQR